MTAMLVCTGAMAGEQYRYLAMVGPTPIRFKAPALQYDPARVLPPLQMSDKAPSSTNIIKPVVQLPPDPVQEESTPAAPPLPPAESSADTPSLPDTPSEEARPDSSQVTPQMLLRYFNADSSREVIVPHSVEFTPPAPPSSGGRSSATYLSPPSR